MTNESDLDLDESPIKKQVKKEPLSYNPDLVLKDDQESPKKKKKKREERENEDDWLSPINQKTSAWDPPRFDESNNLEDLLNELENDDVPVSKKVNEDDEIKRLIGNQA